MQLQISLLIDVNKVTPEIEKSTDFLRSFHTTDVPFILGLGLEG